MRKRIFPLVEIIINVGCISFFFIKIIRYSVVLPNNPPYFLFLYPYQNLIDINLLWLFLLNIFFLFTSVLLASLCLFQNKRFLKIVNLIVFILTVFLYGITMFIACNVGRGF